MHLDIQRTNVAQHERTAFYRLMLDRLAGVPGVESVAASYVTPLRGSTWQNNLTVKTDDSGNSHSTHAYIHVVTPDHFRTYGTPVLEGRLLSTSDTVGAPQVVLVNRALVRNVLGAGSFVSRRIRCDENLKPDAEIVGVVADAKYRSLRSSAPPTVYVPMAQDPVPPPALAVAVRTRGPLVEAVPGLRRAMAESNPNVAFLLRPFESYVADSVVSEPAMAVVSGLFGALAVLLASVGIHGLATYSVMQRRAEIGIRMALGATAGRVVRLLFSQTGRTVAGGILAGSLCAAWASRLTEALLFDVTPGRVWVYGCAAAALVLAAAIAIIGPSLRAARIDLVQTLRQE